MNVTLRPNGVPDVYLNSTSGEPCDLASLDRQIRALQIARKWLQQELIRHEHETGEEA